MNYCAAAFVLSSFNPIAIKMMPVNLFNTTATFVFPLSFAVAIEAKNAVIMLHVPPVNVNVKPRMRNGIGLIPSEPV